MSDPCLRAYVIGQTPRPDLTDDLKRRWPGMTIEVVGALDGLSEPDIPLCDDGDPCAYPLETRLRDGARVVVDAATIEARLQEALDSFAGNAAAHLILCAGPFPSLSVPEHSGMSPSPLIRPFEEAVPVLHDRSYRRLAVLVPFEAQVRPAAGKWRAAGFEPDRVRALSQKPVQTSIPKWVSSWASKPDADAVVFDYVGFPTAILDDVAAGTGLPVIDLGHLALDRLSATLRAP